MNHKAIYSKNLLIKYNFLKSHENDFEIKSAPIDSNTINLYENILYKYLNRKYTLEEFGYFIKYINIKIFSYLIQFKWLNLLIKRF